MQILNYIHETCINLSYRQTKEHYKHHQRKITLSDCGENWFFLGRFKIMYKYIILSDKRTLFTIKER